MNKQIDSEKLIEWLKSIEAEFPSAGEYMTIQIKNIKDKILSLQSYSAECDVQAVMMELPKREQITNYSGAELNSAMWMRSIAQGIIDTERTHHKKIVTVLKQIIKNRDNDIVNLKQQLSSIESSIIEEENKTNDVSIKDVILKEYQNGNIVIATFDGIQVAPLNLFLKQPTDGMLYDLNRNESIVLTFINDPKWINDYAMVKVIRELKRQLEEVTKK